MTEKQVIYSLSVCGRTMLNMHSLNNEGGEGNQIATRMVNVVYRANGEPKLATVNAISGDMFKHIQAEHLYLLAKGLAKGKLDMCEGCQKFSASRILDDPKFMKAMPSQDSAVIDTLLRQCAMDDLEGILIAKGTRSVPRKSVAEFGWVVGLPDYTSTESYFHVRYSAERGKQGEEAGKPSTSEVAPSETKQAKPDKQEIKTEKQAIFHRPASSGIYALVANFEIARIGFNDISQKYPIDETKRKERYRAFMESILYTFIEPNGAMRGTQNPHLVEFEGVITVTNQVVPAPALSPLNENYRKQIEQVAGALNALKSGAVIVHSFDSVGQFAKVMMELIENTEPYKFTW